MNTLTGAWCQFIGWNANCFEIYNNLLYFGDNLGNVAQAYIGDSDLFTNINADMQCAFNYFDDPGRTKRMTMVEPLLIAQGAITPSIGVDVQFSNSTTTAPVTTFTGAGTAALWDVAIWDQSLWTGGVVYQTNWLSVNALGHGVAGFTRRRSRPFSLQ